MTTKTPKTVLNKIVSKQDIVRNAEAFRAYDTYRKAADIIERAEFASGKRITFKSDTGSTLNFEINNHGIHSTIAQNI